MLNIVFNIKAALKNDPASSYPEPPKVLKLVTNIDVLFKFCS